ncbi:hypothetical protein LZ554_006327 [Drepanopeziza brunnea f. sp. 'monogermtubi']|nr:hypothetical protein LZ554_006327 [Drepanopeziza brunnea f. sp. 'monogermtubi']
MASQPAICQKSRTKRTASSYKILVSFSSAPLRPPKRKSPLHLAFCYYTRRRFYSWPKGTRPRTPPITLPEAYDYLKALLDKPADFQAFLTITEFYSKHCTR